MSVESRRAYIDWARGAAVLLMIEAHTTDAWTRPVAKQSLGFRNATILGGFAAPMFLWLAGLGLVLAASRASQRTGRRTAAADAVCRRGIEIFLLAFVFRAQAFILSPGSHPITLFRVDILNVMGLALAATAVVWLAFAGLRARVIAFGTSAAAIALATPIVRTAATVDLLPIWVQWYLRPAGDYTTFTLFPWAGFVFAGACVGSLIAERQTIAETRTLAAIAIVGAALIGLGVWAAGRPSIYTNSSFWTSSPTWFAIRTGVVTLALAMFYVVERLSHQLARSQVGGGIVRGVVFSWQEPLARIGRASLFIYWIHVELVYGYASWLWKGRLPLWATWIAFAGFTALIYAALVWRDRVAGNWRRISAHSGPAIQGAR